jgi:methionyl-tRNA synthetase
VVRQVAVLSLAVMPTAGAKLLDLLGQPESGRAFVALGTAGRLQPNTVLPAPTGVFPRYVEEASGEKGGQRDKKAGP